MKTPVRILGALLASALLSACGGGGGKTAALPTAATTAPSGGSSLPSSGARLTLKIDRSKRSGGRKNAAHARNGLAAHRSPSTARGTKYISDGTQGLQVSITSGGTTQTYYYSLANALYSGAPSNPCSQDPTTYIETCTLVLPTVGPTESFSVLEVDQPAVGADPTTGIGTSIPSNANTLAIGTQNNVTLTPGGYTDLSISMNPIAATFADYDAYADDSADGTAVTIDGNAADRIGLDVGTSPERVVVAANLPIQPTTNTEGQPGSPVFFAPPGSADADGDCFAYIGFSADGTPIGQPLVDANGTPTATTISSSSSHLKLLNWVSGLFNDGNQGNGYVPEPGATPTSTVSIANSAELFPGCFYESLYYDGTQTTSSTITVSNNLTATPPTFTGAPSGNGGTHLTSYTKSLTYEFAPISASPASLTFANTTPQTITGTDPDATEPMDYDSVCNAANGTTVANITSTTTNQFIVTPVAVGACSFAITDAATNVPTVVNVSSSVTQAGFGAAPHVAVKRMKGVRLR
jgi:hypothetical protein